MKYKKGILFKIVFSFCILSIISVILFMHMHILFGATDMQFHMKRIMELNDSINYGYILPRFSFNYFHGSAVMSMYPYLSVLPFVILFRLTSSIIYSYYIFFVIIILLSLTISFFSSLHYSESNLISYLFSITYSISSLYTFEMFTNGDLGVITSLVFLPLVIFGFLDILKGSINYFKLSCGITLMSFCQIAAVSIVIILLCGWLILNISIINKHSIIKFIKSAGISILLTSIIWIPILHIILLNKINTVTRTYLVGFNLKYFIENMSLFTIITMALGIIYINKFNRLDKQMYLLSIFIIIISSKFMPWHFITSLPLINILNQYQFTFRFLIIPQILLSYIFSLSVYMLLSKIKNPKSYILFIILGIIISQMSAQAFIIYRKSNLNSIYFTNYTEVKKFELNKYPHYCDIFNNKSSMIYFINGYTTNHDYYPNCSNKYIKYINNDEGVYMNNKTIKIHHYGYNKFTFSNSKKINKLLLPLLCYKGEQLRIYLNNHLVRYSKKDHLLTLNNINKGCNKIKICYTYNKTLIMVEIILFSLGLILIIIPLIGGKYRTKFM